MSELFLFGAGNSEGVRLAKRVLARRGPERRLVLLDDDSHKLGEELLGVRIEGGLDLLQTAASGSCVANLVARRTASRAAVRRRLVASGVPFLSLVHPDVDAEDCALGAGVLVYEQAILSPETRLGDGSCVLMRGIVGHGATVGADCVIAPGAVLNARVRLGDRVYVGSNSSVLPDVTVGDDVTIGANTMVAADVPAGATVVGVPGQILAAATNAAMPALAAAEPEGGDPKHPAPAVLELEAKLIEVAAAVLGHHQLGPFDNFFDVGGTSLRALQFVDALRTRLELEVPLPQFYALSSMRRLAVHLAGGVEHGLMSRARARALFRRSLLARSG